MALYADYSIIKHAYILLRTYALDIFAEDAAVYPILWKNQGQPNTTQANIDWKHVPWLWLTIFLKFTWKNAMRIVSWNTSWDKNKHLLAACVARAVVGVEWEEAGEMAIVGCSGSWAAQLNSTTEMFPLSPPYTQLQRAQLRRNLRIISVA